MERDFIPTMDFKPEGQEDYTNAKSAEDKALPGSQEMTEPVEQEQSGYVAPRSMLFLTPS